MKDLAPPALELKAVYEKETCSAEPILIMISPGSDPSQELEELARNTVGSDKYHQVPMGQGQQEMAVQLLKQCAEHGEWLCLKNLHLVIAWLPQLEKELGSLKLHDKFRLWLTAEAHLKFPTVLLQSSLKVSFEAPPGIKRNLMRTYLAWGPEAVSQGNVLRAQSMLGLAWFHAICQERRTFIPQGWSKFYEFNLADLRAGLQVIEKMFKKGSGGIQWDFLHGLMENAIYGGRVDNIYDLRILVAYLKQIFTNEALPGSGKPRYKLCDEIPMPGSKEFDDYMRIIKDFPDEDEPRFFGLPANITCSWERMEGNRVITQLRHLRMHDSEMTKFDRDAWTTALSPILNLWKKLNQGNNLHSAKLAIPRETDHEDPAVAFVKLERFNAVSLVQHVHSTLAALSRAIRGTSLLTSQTKQLAGSLLKQETPGIWQSKWEGPEDPLLYLPALMSRAVAIERWAQKAEAGNLLTDVLDLSELFRPDTFLNALRQKTARALKTSIDQLKFAASWSGSIKGAEDTIRISGFQLEGAAFDGSSLRETQHNSAPVASVPPATVAWIPKDAANPYPENEVVSLPIYFSQEREKVVISVDVPCGRDADKWVISGAALFLKNQ